MKRIASRIGSCVLATAAIFAVAAPNAHAANTWNTFDTDDMGRSAASGRAYTIGNIKWQHLVGEGPNIQEDYRMAFTTRLGVSGAPGSCAWLRIFTYEKADGSDEVKLSKRFPAAGETPYGYYGICGGPDGNAFRQVAGADELWTSWVGHKFVRADIRICYTLSYVPPGSNCFADSLHPGD